MSVFSIYTYQFQRITSGGQLSIGGSTSEGGFPLPECTDEEWNNRLQTFRLVLENKELVFEIDKKYIHEIVYNRDHIIIMKFANSSKRKINGEDLEVHEINDYPWCYVIWDNRDNIQRVLIERKPKAWPNKKDKSGTKRVTEIFNEVLDNIMRQKYGMHFCIDPSPTYKASDFWETIQLHPEGISRVHFSFPPPNLGRLLDLADCVTGIRQETGGGYNADLIAPEGGVLILNKDNTHTSSIVNLSSAGGYPVKVYTKDGHTVINISGDNPENDVVAEVPDGLIPLLQDRSLFTKENVDKLIEILNSIKNLY